MVHLVRNFCTIIFTFKRYPLHSHKRHGWSIREVWIFGYLSVSFCAEHSIAWHGSAVYSICPPSY